MRTAIYVRASLDKTGEGLSVERQTAECRKLAKRLGWKVTAVFTDNDVSATANRPRPAWNALLDAIAASEVDALVAYSSSRLYRKNRADLGPLIDLVKPRPEFQIETVASSRIDLSTAQGRMLAGILAEVDQAEAEVLAERQRLARKQRVAAGNYGGGRRPFGHQPVQGGMELVPTEADAIREAAQRLLRGEPIRAILRDWESSGIRSTRGHVWGPSAFRNMMLSPRLAGVHPETGDRVWPAIVTARDHTDLVQLFADPVRLRARRGDRYLLTGLVFCSICGASMNGNPQRDKRRYICRKTGKLHMVIGADALENYIFAVVAETPDPPLRDVHDPAADQASILSRIDLLDAQIAQYVEEGVAAGLAPRDVAAATAALRRERATVEAKLAAVPASVTWEDIQDPTRWREHFDALIERIEVLPADGSRLPADRTRIVWK